MILARTRVQRAMLVATLVVGCSSSGMQEPSPPPAGQHDAGPPAPDAAVVVPEADAGRMAPFPPAEQVDAGPPSPDATSVPVTMPPVGADPATRCNAFAAGYCARRAACSSTIDEAGCTAEGITKLRCAEALKVSPTYEACLRDLAVAPCPATDLPPSCQKVVTVPAPRPMPG
jgi:hypothetical protein